MSSGTHVLGFRKLTYKAFFVRSVSHVPPQQFAEKSAFNSYTSLPASGAGLVLPPGNHVTQPWCFLRLNAVLQRIDIGRTTWLEGIKSGFYPPPIQVSHRNRWISYEIDELQNALIQEMDKEALKKTVEQMVFRRRPMALINQHSIE